MFKKILISLVAIPVFYGLMIVTTKLTQADEPLVNQYSFDTLDNGMQGLWATDHFQSKVTITDIGGGCYDVVRDDTGTFNALPSAYSPGGEGGTTIDPSTTGNISGGLEITVCGTLKNPITVPTTPDDLTGISGVSYSDKYFSPFFEPTSTVTEWKSWGWKFTTCNNGTWTDNDATESQYGTEGPNSTMGDITGDFVPCDKKALKATGGIWMSTPNQQMKFSAFDQGSSKFDKGDVEYWNYEWPGVLHYTAKVMCAKVDNVNNNARFMFQIPDGWPGLSGLFVVSAVHDGGTPGTKGDLYGHAATGDLLTAMNWCEYGFTPSSYQITAGNLVVHK